MTFGQALTDSSQDSNDSQNFPFKTIQAKRDIKATLKKTSPSVSQEDDSLRIVGGKFFHRSATQHLDNLIKAKKAVKDMDELVAHLNFYTEELPSQILYE